MYQKSNGINCCWFYFTQHLGFVSVRAYRMAVAAKIIALILYIVRAPTRSYSWPPTMAPERPPIPLKERLKTDCPLVSRPTGLFSLASATPAIQGFVRKDTRIDLTVRANNDAQRREEAP